MLWCRPGWVVSASLLPLTVSLSVGIPLRIKSYGPSCLRGSQALYNDFRCPLFGILALGPCVVVRCWVEPWQGSPPAWRAQPRPPLPSGASGRGNTLPAAAVRAPRWRGSPLLRADPGPRTLVGALPPPKRWGGQSWAPAGGGASALPWKEARTLED